MWTPTDYRLYYIIFYKRFNHAASLRRENKMTRGEESKPVSAANYLKFIDCTHDDVKQNKGIYGRPPKQQESVT